MNERAAQIFDASFCAAATQNAVTPVGSFDEEHGIEAPDVFVPAPWLRLAVNVLRVNPACGANPSVWLGGVRARIAF